MSTQRTPRQFSLINSNGEELNLLTQKLFLYKPEGLGFERDDTYRKVGDRFVLVNAAPKQATISGKVLFISEDPYEPYFSFARFIEFKPLTLVYRPNPSTNRVYRRPVIVNKLDKTEINKYGYLECGIDFLALSPWYRRIIKQNGFTWPIRWITGDNYDSLTWASDEIVIESDSHSDSPAKLTVWGKIINPTWEHYVNDNLYASGVIYDTIKREEYLVVDNTVDPYYVNVYDSNYEEFIRDDYQNSEFSTTRFIEIQYGINRIKVVEPDDAEEISTAPVNYTAVKDTGAVFFGGESVNALKTVTKNAIDFSANVTVDYAMSANSRTHRGAKVTLQGSLTNTDSSWTDIKTLTVGADGYTVNASGTATGFRYYRVVLQNPSDSFSNNIMYGVGLINRNSSATVKGTSWFGIMPNNAIHARNTRGPIDFGKQTQIKYGLNVASRVHKGGRIWLQGSNDNANWDDLDNAHCTADGWTASKTGTVSGYRYYRIQTNYDTSSYSEQPDPAWTTNIYYGATLYPTGVADDPEETTEIKSPVTTMIEAFLYYDTV